MNLVTIIIPFYKKRKFFSKTINSILNQSYKKFEIIVIYDDKNKKDLDFLKNFKNKKIKIIINKKNLGVGRSRNKGIKITKTKYIAFCDADDIWQKHKLKKQIYFMEKMKADFSHTDYNIIDDEDKIIGKMKIKKKMLYSELLKSCDIGLSTVIVKTEILKKNLFNSLKTKEDYALWLKLLRNGVKVSGINKSLSSWRKSPFSLSSNTKQKIFDAFKLYYFYEKFNLFFSIYLTLRLSIFYFVKRFQQKKDL
tara:strand:- start:2480 stop:3235 length:756 start_codon:yes stop_codon:yes gene_type:complete